MGSRGPQPTPTKVLKLRGSRLARKRERRGEPELPSGMPKRPSRVEGERLDVWEAAARLLNEMGLLTPADGIALEMLADCVCRYRRVVAVLEAGGETYEFATEAGGTVCQQRPEVAIATNLAKLILSLTDRLGLTPAARARLSVERNDPALSEDERLLLQLISTPQRGRKPRGA